MNGGGRKSPPRWKIGVRGLECMCPSWVDRHRRVTIAVLLFDLVVIARRPHEPTMRECGIALSVYIGLATAFGLWVSNFHGTQYGIEFYAGWLTEYSLSVDNLFVFIIIMASFNVPKVYQQQVLMVGIVLALVLRGIFHRPGSRRDSTVLVDLLRIRDLPDLYVGPPGPRHRPRDDGDNFIVRSARRWVKTTDEWHGLKLYIRRTATG